MAYPAPAVAAVTRAASTAPPPTFVTPAPAEEISAPSTAVPSGPDAKLLALVAAYHANGSALEQIRAKWGDAFGRDIPQSVLAKRRGMVDQLWKLRAAIGDAPATTMAGLTAKASMVFDDLADGGGPPAYDPERLAPWSLARDLLALNGGASVTHQPEPAASPIVVPAWAKTVTMTREELQAAVPSLRSLPDILAAARANYGLGWTADDDCDALADLDDTIYARLAAYRCQSADEMAAKVEVLIWRLLEVSGGPEGSINGSDQDVLRSLLRDLRGAPQAIKLPDRAVCPVAEIARQDMECHRRLDAVVTPRGEPTATRVIDRLCGQQDALRELASWQQATSVEGALYAIILAGTEAAYLMEHDVEPTGVQERAKRLDRFLYSALGAIEQCSGISAETVGGEYHMPEDLNPLRDAVGASR